MLSRTTTVGIGEMAVAQPPRQLKAAGLGSCVALALYDRATQVAGLAHIMLPSAEENDHKLFLRFADVVVPPMSAGSWHKRTYSGSRRQYGCRRSYELPRVGGSGACMSRWRPQAAPGAAFYRQLIRWTVLP